MISKVLVGSLTNCNYFVLQNITNATRDNQGCSAYRKYYAQLQFLQSRFPMGSGGAASLPFVW